jgi:O-antigen/teichoic acid export membrane protein
MLNKKFFQDVLWTLITQIVVAISGVLVVYFVSRNFSTEEYGHVYLLKRVSDFTWLVLLFGATVSIPRNKVLIDKIQRGVIESFILLLTPLSILLFILLSKSISLLFLSSLYAYYYTDFCFLVIGMIIFGITYAYLRSILSFKFANYIQIINYSLAPLLPLLFAENIKEYIMSFSLIIFFGNSLIFCFILVIIIKSIRKQKVNFNDNIRGYKQLIKYGLYRLPGLTIAGFIFTLPVTLLNWRGQGYEVGLLSQIFQIISIVNMPINSMGLILLPNTAKLIAENKLHEAKQDIRKLMKFTVLGSTIVAILIIIFSTTILTIVNGHTIEFKNIYYGFIFLGIIPLNVYNLLRNPIDAISEKPYSTLIVLKSFFIAYLLAGFLFWIGNIDSFFIILLSSLLVFKLLGIFSIKRIAKLLY